MKLVFAEGQRNRYELLAKTGAQNRNKWANAKKRKRKRARKLNTEENRKTEKGREIKDWSRKPRRHGGLQQF